MVIGNGMEKEAGETRKVFRDKPHTTWDNYFSGDRVMNWLGENGFGATMTCRRDRLPNGVPGHYLHKKKTDTKARSKAARFHEPITMVKYTPAVEGKEEYERVHTSFQSTSSCNISSVNALIERVNR